MKKSSVVNVRTDEFDVYIGRAVNRARDPRCHKASIWANPFKPKSRTPADMKKMVVKYEKLMRERLEGDERDMWLRELRKLRGKRLGCWCAPQPCHGEVLAKLAEALDS